MSLLLPGSNFDYTRFGPGYLLDTDGRTGISESVIRSYNKSFIESSHVGIVATTGAAVLPNTAFTLTADLAAGTTSVTYADKLTNRIYTNVIQLDIPRAIRCRGNANPIYIYGWDVYGVPMQATLGPDDSTVTKAFKWIRLAFTVVGEPAANVDVGTQNIFGLPFFLPSAAYLVKAVITKTGNLTNNGGLSGAATLIAGTATIPTAAVTANSIILVSYGTAGAPPVAGGFLRTENIVAGVSFDITSSSNTDVAIVNWSIVNPTAGSSFIYPVGTGGVVTNPSTAISGDVRGTVSYPNDSGLTGPIGLSVYEEIWALNPVDYRNTTVSSISYKDVYGVPQFYLGDH